MICNINFFSDMTKPGRNFPGFISHSVTNGRI